LANLLCGRYQYWEAHRLVALLFQTPEWPNAERLRSRVFGAGMPHNMTPQLWQKIQHNLDEAFVEARGTREAVGATTDGFMTLPSTFGQLKTSRGSTGYRLSRRAAAQKDSSKIGKTDSDRAER
jgi:hypothetical protein